MIKKIRGFNDWLLHEGEDFLKAKNEIEEYLKSRGFSYIELPIIEEKELFKRLVGNETDVVQKEMFEIIQRKEGREWVLRPESTAQVSRAFLEKKLDRDNSWKERRFFYFSPLFRYERPQKGRYRQFYSFGIEEFYIYDNEARLSLLTEMIFDLQNLFVWDNLTCKINFLPRKRTNYIKDLTSYMNKHIDTLCDDCKTRLKSNPLRILDCKVDAMSEIIKKAPKIIDYLNSEDKLFFASFEKNMKELNIDYFIDPNLVRGLDYYNGIIFEIVEKNNQTFSICSGGEYTGMLEQIANKKLPIKWGSLGWGLGFERVQKYLKVRNPEKDKILIIKKTNSLDFYNAREFLLQYYRVTVKNYSRHIAKEINWAEQNGFHSFIIIGEEEIRNRKFQVRGIESKEIKELLWRKK